MPCITTTVADPVFASIMQQAIGGAEGKIHVCMQYFFQAWGIAAMPLDSDGVPFNMGHGYASGNIAADMYCNVAAESTGRVLAVIEELGDTPVLGAARPDSGAESQQIG